MAATCKAFSQGISKRVAKTMNLMTVTNSRQDNMTHD